MRKGIGVVLLVTLVFSFLVVFSSTALAANPDKIYARDGNAADIVFIFADLWDAYSDDNAAYIEAWVNSTKVSMVFGSRVLSFSDFFAKFGDDIVSTPEEYNSLSTAKLLEPPTTVSIISPTGEQGTPIANPDIAVGGDFRVIYIY